MPATYEPIATTTLGSAGTTITFSSIPATYTDLKLILVGQNTVSAYDTWLSFNGVTTGGLYSGIFMQGNGTSGSSFTDTAANQGVKITPAGINVSPNWSYVEVDIFSYAGSSVSKTCLHSHFNDKNGSGVVERAVSLFRSNSAISSMSIYTQNGNLAAGTRATIYGIKAA